ncbi:MAG TPA: SET domain-containing protein, partial [Gammaproteobacteria bacterium]|nr:SET domain-containing protein [Gammaproteobacteria bacterium]
MNHASEEECNVGVTYANYKGLLVLVYYARKDIDSLAPLLVNYVDSRTHENRKFPEQESNLSFTKSHAVVFNDVARATAKVVNKQGMDYFKAGNFTAAKRKFKQAVGLTENAPENDTDKVTCLYNLASTYFMLSGQSKKYVERAKEWLTKAQQFPTYADKASEKLKVLADPYSVIPVCQLGDLEKKDIAGYYFLCLETTVSDDHVLMSRKWLPSTGLLMQNIEYPGAPTEAEFIQKLESIFSEHPERKKGTRVYILPHKRNETSALTRERLLQASHQSKIRKFGFIHGGKITWMGTPAPLDAKYSHVVKSSPEEWKTRLVASSLSELIAEHGVHGISTPQELNFCDLIPPNLVPTPTEIVYQKGNGKIVRLNTDRFSEKVSRSRGIEWTFTNGISIPQLLRDFIDGKLGKKFVSLPGRGNEFGVDVAQDLSLACKFPESVGSLTDEQIQRITRRSKIGIQKVTALQGFGAVAAEFIKEGEIVVFYAGEVTDYIAPLEKSVEHSMLLCREDGTRVRDNLSIRSYRRGNYAGFVNHSNDASQHNIRANALKCNGCVVVIYEATRD